MNKMNATKLGKYRVRRAETEYEVCPFCGNVKWNFCINFSLGVYRCWACNKGGSIKDLKGLLVLGKVEGIDLENMPVAEKVTVEFLTIPEGYEDVWLSGAPSQLSYLHKRGVETKDMILWKIKGKGNRLLFPLYDKDMLVYYVEKDIANGNWYLPQKERRDVLWLMRGQHYQDRRVFLVEGIMDGIRICQCGYGVVVLLGKEIFAELWRKLIMMKLRPILMLDADVTMDYYKKIFDMYGSFFYIKLKKGDPDEYSVEDLQKIIEDSIECFDFRKSLEVRLKWKSS